MHARDQEVLLSGAGAGAHKSKAGETFREGEPVRPTDDLEALQRRAAQWLPHRGKHALDKGQAKKINAPVAALYHTLKSALAKSFDEAVDEFRLRASHTQRVTLAERSELLQASLIILGLAW